MKFKFNRVALALACTVGTGALSAVQPAFAQSTPAPQGTMRVDVTGTNIRRVDVETASPVIVLTADDLVKSGYTTVSEVLRDIAANNQGLLSQGFQGAFAAAGSGVALRGLGVGATLVLVDGLRMVAYPLSDDGQRSFVDTSSIPFSAIERVEVLLDGASAIYGSDAIGGVVNFILKKNFKGVQITGEGGQPFASGGGSNYHASITTGFDEGAWSGFFTGEYRKQDSISFTSRSGEDWARLNWKPYGGNDLRAGALSAPTITNPILLTPVLQRPGSSATDPTAFAFLDSRCNFTQRQASECLYDNYWDHILPETENINLVGRVAYRFGQDWTASLTGSWFDSKGEQQRRPFAVPAGSAAPNIVSGPGIIPYLANGIGSFTVPANYPGNTLGVPAIVRALVPDIPNQNRQVETQTTRIVADLTGTAWGWDMRFAAGYQFAESKIENNGYVNYNALLAALNNPTNPLLLTGGNDPAIVATYGASVPQKDTNEYDFIQFNAQRDLPWRLDGGPVALAVGASYYYQKLNADNAQPCKDGTVAGLNCFYAVGDQSNTAVFAEINVPVLKTLELGAAIRYDYYDTYGGQFTPKISAKWTPIREVAVRGTWGQGFRAPNIMESGEAGLAFTANASRDLANCPVSLPNGQPNLSSPLNVPAYCSFTPTYLQTTSQNLEPEKSNNWTIGLIVEPVPNWSTSVDYYSIELKNQIVPAFSLPTFDPTAVWIRGPQNSVTFGDGSQGLSPAGIVAYVPDQYTNANKTETTGLDLQSTWSFNMPWAWNSRGKLGVQWSHIFDYTITAGGVDAEVAGTHGPAGVSGNTGTPRDRVQLTGQWAKGPFTATLIGNYVSSFDMTDPSQAIDNCDAMAAYGNPFRFSGGVPGEFCKVESFWYWNLNLQWQINPQAMVQLSVQNLFDQGAPVDLGTYGGSSGANRQSSRGAPYNPSLHMPGVIGASWLLGFSYKF